MTAKPLPEPLPISFTNLIRDVENGIIKIPNFQREFVWPMKKTIELLDSIAKGYPIGSFLLWETNEKLPNLRNIGNIILPETPEGHVVKYVLDGQQRITSLFACMKEVNIENRKYALFYDLENKIFIDNPTTFSVDMMSDAPIVAPFVPVSFLLRDDDDDIRIRIGELSRVPKLFTEFNRVRAMFREYRFATIQIRETGYEEALEMFIRINTQGTPLTLIELMMARILSPQFSLRNELKKFMSEIKDGHYDSISDHTILQTLSLLHKDSCKAKEILQIKKDDFIELWDPTKNALKSAIDFVTSIIECPDHKLLPYDAILAPIAYFFHYNNHNQPNTDQTRFITEWFWHTSLSNRFSSATETKLREDILLMQAVLRSETPRLIYAEQISASRVKEEIYTSSDAFSIAVLGLLNKMKPLQLDNNTPTLIMNTMSKLSRSELHHIFPKKYLEKQVKAGNLTKEQLGYSDSLANICFMPKLRNIRISDRAPSDYLTELQRQNGELSTALRSHLIDDEAERLLKVNDFTKFIDHRATIIAKALNERLNRVM